MPDSRNEVRPIEASIRPEHLEHVSEESFQASESRLILGWLFSLCDYPGARFKTYHVMEHLRDVLLGVNIICQSSQTCFVVGLLGSTLGNRAHRY